MKPLQSSLTFWALLVFALLVGLQWFPITGVFMMMLAAPIWEGYMPHVVALALVFDLLIKKRPRSLLLIPLLPYLIYYAFLFWELNKIGSLEKELRQDNPSEIIAYDPKEHSLMADSNITQFYKVPVSYSSNSNFPEGFLSHRLVTQGLCRQAKNIKDFTHTFGVSWSRFGERLYYKNFPNVCYFRMPEKPDKAVLKIEEHEERNKEQLLQRTTHKFFLGQQMIGEYVSAYYSALPYFPKFVIGCALISSSPEWKCIASLAREKRHLNTFPIDANEDEGPQNNWIASRLLKIEKYTEEDLKKFQDYPETKEVLGALIQQKKDETPEDFDEWGLRKDSLYQPKIGENGGYPSFEGDVYTGRKAGPFYGFIKKYEGRVVYLDVKPNGANGGEAGFSVYSVCKATEHCYTRADKAYNFKKENGDRYFNEDGRFRGFFFVGPETVFEHQYNKGDNDTITILTAVPPEKLNQVGSK